MNKKISFTNKVKKTEQSPITTTLFEKLLESNMTKYSLDILQQELQKIEFRHEKK